MTIATPLKAQPKASHFIDGDYVEDNTGTPFESIFLQRAK